MFDLFAKVLINGITHLIKRGFYRDYISYSQEIRSIIGKVDFGISLKKNLLSIGRAHCSFDELNHNVIHNQILKTIIYYLLSSNQIDEELRSELASLNRYFHQIDYINLTSKTFRQATIHRNNYFYLFLLNICELIYENILISEDTGETRFKDFFRDEVKMRLLFENFVRNFYDMEQKSYDVSREYINWKFKSANASLLPRMQTDISLESENRKIIIDTKYYREAFQNNYDVEKFRSSNLNQIYAYLKQVEYKDEKSTHAEGILMYPAVNSNIDFEGEIEGHKIRIMTLNLNQDWKLIKRDLLGIINN